MSAPRVLVAGGGVGGLACGLSLAAQGFAVTLCEAAERVGGKIRTVVADGRAIDAGPTVFTMRWVFDELFAQAGSTVEEHLRLVPIDILARHAWGSPQTLDLLADRVRAADAIGRFAGAGEARRYLDFCAQTRRTHDTLLSSFMTAERPSPVDLVRRAGVRGLLGANPFADMWSALGRYFHDPRLRQLFGRYATYCGSSPFLAPATLMLVAHVEQEGVWVVEGGMVRLAEALRTLATKAGVEIRTDAPVAEILIEKGRASGVRLLSGETVGADIVVLNADVNALATGRFGSIASRAAGVAPTKARSLSAMTFCMVAKTRGFPLVRHNVFFSGDYASEFDEIFGQSRVPREPTVYVCAQDRDERGDVRDDRGVSETDAAERLLILINAPAIGDRHAFNAQEIAACQERTFALLARSGLQIEPAAAPIVTTPTQFETLFPATGGALYGAATHGAMASFSRPASRTKLPGLYLAGGSAHPGAGVPMAALSGRIAAQAIVADLASTRPSRAAAMPGGISTR